MSCRCDMSATCPRHMQLSRSHASNDGLGNVTTAQYVVVLLWLCLRNCVMVLWFWVLAELIRVLPMIQPLYEINVE
eukprot:scaffold318637_cov166-Cyclotella_meneghiniana.AAC.1